MKKSDPVVLLAADVERMADILRAVADILRDAGQEGAYWTLHKVANELLVAMLADD